MNEKVTLENVHAIIKLLDSIEPAFIFEQPVRDGQYDVNEALARGYNDIAFRKHIKNLINKQIYKSAVNSDSEKEMWLNAGRIMVLKELYRDMERAYTQFLPKGKKSLLTE